MRDQQLQQQIQSGEHYYSVGDHLRHKHELAGDQFARWILDHIVSWTSAKILDAGGGWGRFVWLLTTYYDIDLSDIVITDLSHGMLTSAFEQATDQHKHLDCSVADIERLPFQDKSFDIVMANKVLYHLVDIPLGIQEIARVLHPQGTLIASTNSEKIKPLIIDLHYQAMDKLEIPYEPEPLSPFSMENGHALLSPYFGIVETHYFTDDKWLDDAQAIRATYETIGRYRNLLSNHDLPQNRVRQLPATVEKLATEIIQRDGKIFSPSMMGTFICRQPEKQEVKTGDLLNV